VYEGLDGPSANGRALGAAMISVGDVRRMALSLEGTVEQDHHGFPSFRVGGKIFATLPDDEHLHVMLDEERIREIVEHDPHACEEKWWGKKLAAVRVSLPDVGRDHVAAMIEEAWSARRSTHVAAKRSKRGGP
jgi:hypothetical protein